MADVVVTDPADTEQIWTASGWYGSFALQFRPDEIGYGMSQGEVTRVIATDALMNGYLSAMTEGGIDRVPRRALHRKFRRGHRPELEPIGHTRRSARERH